eukprot:1065396-Pelagomonas_calceolata.AAC.12
MEGSRREALDTILNLSTVVLLTEVRLHRYVRLQEQLSGGTTDIPPKIYLAGLVCWGAKRSTTTCTYVGKGNKGKGYIAVTACVRAALLGSKGKHRNLHQCWKGEGEGYTAVPACESRFAQGQREAPLTKAAQSRKQGHTCVWEGKGRVT